VSVSLQNYETGKATTVHSKPQGDVVGGFTYFRLVVKG
jgi:hypothetical protein